MVVATRSCHCSVTSGQAGQHLYVKTDLADNLSLLKLIRFWEESHPYWAKHSGKLWTRTDVPVPLECCYSSSTTAATEVACQTGILGTPQCSTGVVLNNVIKQCAR